MRAPATAGGAEEGPEPAPGGVETEAASRGTSDDLPLVGMRGCSLSSWRSLALASSVLGQMMTNLKPGNARAAKVTGAMLLREFLTL